MFLSIICKLFTSVLLLLQFSNTEHYCFMLSSAFSASVLSVPSFILGLRFTLTFSTKDRDQQIVYFLNCTKGSPVSGQGLKPCSWPDLGSLCFPWLSYVQNDVIRKVFMGLQWDNEYNQKMQGEMSLMFKTVYAQ